MQIVRCDNCGRKRPEPYERRRRWAQLRYSADLKSTALDLCPGCAPAMETKLGITSDT